MKYGDVRNWIMTQCSYKEMEKIREDLKSRRDILVSDINVGDRISITEISPKYLNGLTGKFHKKGTGRGKARGSIMLDEASTAILKSKEHRYIAEETKEYVLTGIPMVCFVKEE